MELIFATANAHKCAEAQAILGPSVSIIMPCHLGFTGQIPETGTTMEENARQKAQYIWNTFKRPCFADDSGLEADALGGAPGVYSARYAGEHATNEDNLHKLLTNMKGQSLRTARFRCVVCLIDANGVPVLFDGRVEGRLLDRLCGQGGFGYDPLFVPEGFDQTFAQLAPAIKNGISHRGRALEKMASYLKQPQ